MRLASALVVRTRGMLSTSKPRLRGLHPRVTKRMRQEYGSEASHEENGAAGAAAPVPFFLRRYFPGHRTWTIEFPAPGPAIAGTEASPGRDWLTRASEYAATAGTA